MKLPSDRFEASRGERKRQFSIQINQIQINQQWHVCVE